MLDLDVYDIDTLKPNEKLDDFLGTLSIDLLNCINNPG